MTRRSIICLLVLGTLTACSATRYVTTPAATVTLLAAMNLNPDLQGRASPVEVRIYELSARQVFDSLDFFATWDRPETVLGPQLLSSTSLVIMPREARQLRIELQRDAEYVAIVAAYRDIDRATWRLVYEVNSDWFQHHRVQLTDRGITPVKMGRRETARRAVGAKQ